MRILLVAHGFPPAAMGGTEIYTHDLAHALRAAGDEVFVFTREANPALPEYAIRNVDDHGIPVTLVNNTFTACRTFEDTYRNAAIRRVGARVLDDVQPDVVHVQHLTCLSTELTREFAQRRIPTIFTLNDYWLICHRGQLLNLDYERCAGPFLNGCTRCTGTTDSRADSWNRLQHMRSICDDVTHFLAPSRTLRDRFLAFGIAPERITYQEQGIDRTRFRVLRRSDGGDLRIGFMGSLLRSKAPHLLFEAFAELPPNKASLHVYGSYAPYHGDDSYRDILAAAPRGKGVYIHGPVPHEDVASTLASLDVIVVPSIWIENAPFVIREAFAAGVPVIGSALGGMAEMIADDRNGLLFEAGNAQDLRRCLARLIDEPPLLDRLRSGIPTIKTITEDAEWTRGFYMAHLHRTRHPSGIRIRGSEPRDEQSTGFEGHVDRCEDGWLLGWAWNPDTPNDSIALDILVDGASTATVSATLYRPDLERAHKGNGRHAFEYRMPESINDGMPHEVRVVYAGTGRDLLRSPRTVCAADDQRRSAPPAALPGRTRHRSLFGGLWTDLPNAADVIAGKETLGWISADEARLLAEWTVNGFVVLPQAVPLAWIDELDKEVDEIWSGAASDRFFVEFWENGNKTIQPAGPPFKSGRVKLLDLYAHSERARQIVFSEPILRFLTLVFERPALAFQSLYFRWGSQQDMHQDTAFVKVSSPLEFAASWIALEDIQPDSGELEYYVGSHLLDDYLFAGRYKWMPFRSSEYEAFLESLHVRSRERGLERRRFRPNKGDVLIWSADLVHGGSKNSRDGVTRKSLVTHYCPTSCEPVYAGANAAFPRHQYSAAAHYTAPSRD